MSIEAGPDKDVFILSSRVFITANRWDFSKVEGATYDFSANRITGYNLNRRQSGLTPGMLLGHGTSITGGTILGKTFIPGAPGTAEGTKGLGPVTPDDFPWIVPAGGELLLAADNVGADEESISIALVLLEHTHDG